MTERSSLNLQFLDCPLADNLLAFQIEYLPLIYSGFEPNDAVISAKSNWAGHGAENIRCGGVVGPKVGASWSSGERFRYRTGDALR